jgi:hypothetical protein
MKYADPAAMLVANVFGSPVGGPAGRWGLNGLKSANFVGIFVAAAWAANASDVRAPKSVGAAATPAVIEAMRRRAWPRVYVARHSSARPSGLSAAVDIKLLLPSRCGTFDPVGAPCRPGMLLPSTRASPAS